MRRAALHRRRPDRGGRPSGGLPHADDADLGPFRWGLALLRRSRRPASRLSAPDRPSRRLRVPQPDPAEPERARRHRLPEGPQPRQHAQLDAGVLVEREEVADALRRPEWADRHLCDVGAGLRLSVPPRRLRLLEGAERRRREPVGEQAHRAHPLEPGVLHGVHPRCPRRADDPRNVRAGGGRGRPGEHPGALPREPVRGRPLRVDGPYVGLRDPGRGGDVRDELGDRRVLREVEDLAVTRAHGDQGSFPAVLGLDVGLPRLVLGRIVPQPHLRDAVGAPADHPEQ